MTPKKRASLEGTAFVCLSTGVLLASGASLPDSTAPFQWKSSCARISSQAALHKGRGEVRPRRLAPLSGERVWPCPSFQGPSSAVVLRGRLPLCKMVSEREAAASPVAFVGDGGEAGRKGEGEGSAAASAVRVNPLAMIQECLTLNLECSLDRVDGQLCVLFPMRNCRVAASAPSGLCSRSRKKEPYSVGDIWRLLFTPKEQYVFNYVQNSGNRYINVLERPRITLAIKAMPPLPPSKHANLEPPPGAAAAAAAAHEEATRNGDLELVNAVLNTAVEALPIDPALPVDVCGFAAAETPEAPALNPEAEDSAKRRRPAAWLLPVGLEGETDFFAWQTRGALAALEEEAGAEGGAVVEEETAAEGRCGVEGTREKAFALCVLRMQRPLVQRSASILTQGVFEEVLENLRSVVAAKRSRKSLDAFTYRPRPGASAGDASKVSGANYGAEARGQSALSAAASLGEEKRQSLSQPASHPAAYRRRFEATRAATASRSGLHPSKRNAAFFLNFWLLGVGILCRGGRGVPLRVSPALSVFLDVFLYRYGSRFLAASLCRASADVASLCNRRNL